MTLMDDPVDEAPRYLRRRLSPASTPHDDDEGEEEEDIIIVVIIIINNNVRNIPRLNAF